MKPSRVTGAHLCVCGGQVVPEASSSPLGSAHQRSPGAQSRGCHIQRWASHNVREAVSHLKRLHSLNTPHSTLPLTGGRGQTLLFKAENYSSNPHLASFSWLTPKHVGNYSTWLFRWFPPLQPAEPADQAPRCLPPQPLAAGTAAWHSLGPGLH